MRRWFLAMICLTVTGCARVEPQRTLEEVFPNYRYKSVDTLFVRWGPPEQSLSNDGGIIFTWEKSELYTSTNAAPTTGFIGSKPIVVTTPTTETNTVVCRFEVHADNQKRIKGIWFRGADGICDKWLQMLR